MQSPGDLPGRVTVVADAVKHGLSADCQSHQFWRDAEGPQFYDQVQVTRLQPSAQPCSHLFRGNIARAHFMARSLLSSGPHCSISLMIAAYDPGFGEDSRVDRRGRSWRPQERFP